MFLSNNAKGKIDHSPDKKRVRESHREILKPHCRSMAGKTLRHKNSNHRKKVKFVCTDDCQSAFDKVKLLL